jgi:hypothetical protein
MNDSSSSDRVVYLGTSRRQKRRWFGWLRSPEPDGEWRQQLALEMEAACQEMSRRGLRLVQIVPVMSAASLRGSWTAGVWLSFTQAAPNPPSGSPLQGGRAAVQQARAHQFVF